MPRDKKQDVFKGKQGLEEDAYKNIFERVK